KKLIQKVSVHESSQCNKNYYPGTPNRVEIVLQNGKTFSEKVIHPKGSYKNPMTDQEVEDKFKFSTSAYNNPNWNWNVDINSIVDGEYEECGKVNKDG
ncbi:MAG: MmgE/PrpD family protein, partial [Bacteroidetes bacterium]|nr:MmgE/PrpD family protein [Bacteroidota bacterium]